MSDPLLLAERFLDRADRLRVRQAIAEAERNTSGEIRVHLDDRIEENVLDHAAFVFEELGMHRTRDRNGVLFYVSVADHKLAVLGDDGINKQVPQGFWQDVIDLVTAHFKQGRHADGLIAGVQLAGEKLGTFFPFRHDDRNELSDEISIGN